MSKLTCDICGTPYSASEDKCPTCGYARAMVESAYDEEMAQVTRERVRGGRFSRKNVHKRMKQQAETEAPVQEPAVPEAPVQEPAVPEQPPVEAVQPAEDMTEEFGAAFAAMTIGQPQEAADEPESEPEEAVQEPEEAFFPVLIPDIDLPEEEPLEEPADGGEPMFVPLILPADEILDDEEPEEPAQKKKPAPVLWFVAIGAAVLLLLSLILLLTRCSQPGPGVPEQTVATTEATESVTGEPTQPTTEPVTEAPTDPPTEAPTAAPTEAPTDPPTEAPTEAPTKPLLDVELVLNYYDLTFTSTGQATRLKAEGIPAEDITWISDDPAIATVSETGLITPVSGGRTTIRAVYGEQEAVVKVHCSIR